MIAIRNDSTFVPPGLFAREVVAGVFMRADPWLAPGALILRRSAAINAQSQALSRKLSGPRLGLALEALAGLEHRLKSGLFPGASSRLSELGALTAYPAPAFTVSTTVSVASASALSAIGLISTKTSRTPAGKFTAFPGMEAV